MAGSLPKEIGFMSTLQFLAVEGNSLTGKFAPEICDIEDMLALTMMENEFTGSIPDCVKDMSSLQMLVMSNNEFDGELPDLSRLVDMKYLVSLPVPLSIFPLSVLRRWGKLVYEQRSHDFGFSLRLNLIL